MHKSHCASFMLFLPIGGGFPGLLVLVEIPLAHEDREEGNCSKVNDNPSDLNAKVHSN